MTATWALAALTQECSGSRSCGVAAALIMAIVPAHIMRSVGGGYDNESIAMTAMCLTFYCWARALRADPMYVTAYRSLGNTYMMQEQFAAALETYRRGLERSPGDVELEKRARLAARMLAGEDE